MRVGALRDRVTILQPAAGQDTLGQPNTGFRARASAVPADVRFLGGIEAIKGGAEAAIAKASVRIRYRTDVTAAMRLQDERDGTLFRITAVLPDRQHRSYVDFACEVIR